MYMTTSGRSGNRSIERARIQQRLAPTPKVRQTPITNFGSVAQARGYQSSTSRMPSSITFTLDNSAGVAVATYVIGDPNGLVQGALGVTWTQPTTVQGSTVAAVQESFSTMPVLVKGINYASTSGAVQFSQLFAFCEADVNGFFNRSPININEFLRNDAQNPNLQTATFDDPWELDANSGFQIVAGIAQLVTVTLILGGAAGR